MACSIRPADKGIRIPHRHLSWAMASTRLGVVPPPSVPFCAHRSQSGIDLFISFDRFPAVESRIGPAIDLLHARGQRCAHTPQMIADLFAGGPVAVAQLTPEVFSRLGDKRQHRLIAFLAFVLWVVALASAHLLSVERVHGGVGVDGYDFQL